MTIETGTRVYYRGDRANAPGRGVVAAILPSVKWGDDATIELEDGRRFTVKASMIKDKDAGNGTTRLVTWDAYQNWRAAYLARA